MAKVIVAEGSLWNIQQFSAEVLKSLTCSPFQEAIPPTNPCISLSSYEYEGAILQFGIDIVRHRD